MQGFLNLSKPAGFTSHDCVAKVRRLLKLKRVGHAGTLDPAAIGVLPIAMGKATRLLQYLRQDKAYEATIRLGISTSTDDLEGETLLAHPVPDLGWETVQAALPAFVGTIQQIPPNYSAIQVQGRRLYDLARTGEAITVPSRQVEIFSIEVLDWRPGDFPELDVAIACGPGTYIRSIARDLGNALAVGGTLAALRRTMSSGFNLANSLTLETLEAQIQQGSFQPVDPELSLQHLELLTLPVPVARRWCQGQRIALDEAGNAVEINRSPAQEGEKTEEEAMAKEEVRSPLPEPQNQSILRVQHESGQFLGITAILKLPTGSLLVPQMVFEPAV